jgi:hypothetical protein
MNSKDPMEQVEQLLANCPYQLPDFLVTTIRAAAQDAKRRQLAAAREAAAAAAAAAADDDDDVSNAATFANGNGRTGSSRAPKSSPAVPGASGPHGGPFAVRTSAAAGVGRCHHGGKVGSSAAGGFGRTSSSPGLQQSVLGSRVLGVERVVPRYVPPYRGYCRMQSISVKVR